MKELFFRQKAFIFIQQEGRVIGKLGFSQSFDSHILAAVDKLRIREQVGDCIAVDDLKQTAIGNICFFNKDHCEGCNFFSDAKGADRTVKLDHAGAQP